MRQVVRGPWCGVLGVALLACADPGPVSSGIVPMQPPEPVPLTREDARPNLVGPLVQRHPRLRELSRFAQQRLRGEETSVGQRGPVAIGNGRVFALLGMAEKANTLHGLVGPGYDRRSRMFADLALQVVVDGQDWPTDGLQAVARVRGAPVGIADERGGRFELMTVDVAPVLSDGTVPDALVRYVQVHNNSPDPVQIDVRLETSERFALVDDRLVAEGPDDRRLGLVPLGGADLYLDNADRVFLRAGEVLSGEYLVAAFAITTADTPDDARALAASLSPLDEVALLEDTLDHWADRSAQGLQIDLPDAWMMDWIEVMRTTIDAQVSHQGAVSPMSRYTRAWLRDTIGPVRAWLRLGLNDDARDALLYLYRCHAVAGDYANSCSAILGSTPAPPDWAALPPLAGRVAAEGPSYVGLAWAEHVRFSGQTTQLTPRWDYVLRSVLGQETGPGGLQPFSGDETYRLTLGVALGAGLDEPWEDVAWSANSLLLRAGTADALADVAEAQERSGDVQILRAIADDARASLEAGMLREDGALLAALPRVADVDWQPRPFEDVTFKTTWSRAYAPDDPVHLGALQAQLDEAHRGDGLVVSAPDPLYQTGIYASGFATGMTPGYALSALAATGHPLRDGARRQAFVAAGPTGTYPEGYLVEGRQAAQLIYDPDGIQGDTVARARPWEAGIVLDALLQDLLGVEPLADGAIQLSPRAPAGVQPLTATNLMVRDTRLAITVSWNSGWQVRVRHAGGVPAELDVRVPLGTEGPVGLVLEGPGEDGALQRAPGGELVAVFPRWSATAGDEAVFMARNLRGAFELDRAQQMDGVE